MIMNRRIIQMISVFLGICLLSNVFAIPISANEPEITEEELIRQIENNTATVTHEVRSFDSFTEEEISKRPDLQQLIVKLNTQDARTINYNYVIGDVYTNLVVTNDGVKVTYTSCPKVSFSVTDVGTAGSADIYSTFTIVESVTVGDTYNAGWNNAIEYKNMSASMGCGVNTAFTDNIALSGNAAGTVSANIKGIISWIADEAGFATVSQILNAFDMITYSGGYRSNRDISTPFVRVVSAKMDDLKLYSDSHNLCIQSSISTIDSGEEEDQSTKAVVEWSYDVYFFVGSVSPVYRNETISFNLDYLVNVI